MNKGILCFAAVALFVCGSCAEKKEKKEVSPVAVKVETICESSINGSQKYSGTIEEISGTALSFSSGGTIKTIYVDEGQMVTKGQMVAVIDETSLRNALEVAAAARSQAEDSYKRMKLLHDNGSLPEIQWIQTTTQLRQAQAQERISRKNLKDSRIIAPFSGYISEKKAEVGQNVNTGEEVVKLVKIDQVKVKISVPENEIAKIHKGQTFSVTVSAAGNSTYMGKVTEKGVSADQMSRSYDVKALIQNTGNKLLPGMICDVYTDFKQGGTAIFIPTDVVQIGTDNSNFVWLVVNGKAHKQTVIPSGETDQGVRIIEGLTAGDKLVTEGQNKICEGMKITEQSGM